jgi:hypothetical protein
MNGISWIVKTVSMKGIFQILTETKAFLCKIVIAIYTILFTYWIDFASGFFYG